MKKPIETCWERYKKESMIDQLPEEMRHALKDVFYVGAYAVMEMLDESIKERRQQGNVRASADKIYCAGEEINQYIDQRHKDLKHEIKH